MNVDGLKYVLGNQQEHNHSVLFAKSAEYASEDDVLHNFKTAAAFNDETPEEALWGFLTKHLISLRDMVKSSDEFPMEVWCEKIGDAQNYLTLLKAIVAEEELDRQNEQPDIFSDYSSTPISGPGSVRVLNSENGDSVDA